MPKSSRNIITKVLRPWFVRRARATDSWTGHIRTVQWRQLQWLLRRGAGTAYGEKYDFDQISSYEAFAQRVPVVSYEDIRQHVMAMVAGRRNVLWPGRCRHFAQSSGTSDGKSKYIPITSDSFSMNHYAGGRDVVAHYLRHNPDSRIFDGKSFILGGSFANELKDVPRGTTVGDLSANLIANINPIVNLARIPSKRVTLMADWKEKLPALVEASLGQDVTNISGVPSWFMTVIRSIIERAGATNLHDVWPNLEVFFHGGLSFEPYLHQYHTLTDPSRMRYLETYNASEGFFAMQSDPTDHAMLMLLDGGVFFEFVPLEEADKPFPAGAVPAWGVEAGRTYALVITACNGLWRYAIGDTVCVESTDPLKISIAGRTHHFINAFGEELMVHNAEAAMAQTCLETGASVLNYTAAPVYAEGGRHGRHQWLIEWNTPPADIADFARRLDSNLQAVNSDYQAKRAGNIFLDCLSITTARPVLFDDWLARHGKLGGQRKVPRLSNNRRIIDEMLSMNQ